MGLSRENFSQKKIIKKSAKDNFMADKPEYQKKDFFQSWMFSLNNKDITNLQRLQDIKNICFSIRIKIINTFVCLYLLKLQNCTKTENFFIV